MSAAQQLNNNALEDKNELRMQYRFYARSIMRINRHLNFMDKETRQRATRTIDNIKLQQWEIGEKIKELSRHGDQA